MSSAHWISNSFSLNMLRSSHNVTIHVQELTLTEAQQFAHGAMSSVGHANTAELFSQLLGRPVPMNRQTISLEPEDKILIGQYVGERLDEYAKHRPEHALIKWLLIHYTFKETDA
jgi:hypothetical protein